MSGAEGIISYYNRINGKKIVVATLRSFLLRIQNHLDSDGHGPHAKILRGIQTRVAKELKESVGYDLLHIHLNPIKLLKKKAKAVVATFAGPKKSEKPVKGTSKKWTPLIEGLGLGFTKEGQGKIYKIVNDMIMKEIEKGGLFWRKPWNVTKGGAPLTKSNYACNFKTGTVYTGINFWVTNYIARSRGYTSRYFLSVQQANALGGSVVKHAKLWPILFFTFIYVQRKPVKRRLTEEQYNALSSAQRSEVDVIPVVQYYNVVNAIDIEGIKFPAEPKAISPEENTDVKKIESCEAIVKGMPKLPPIGHGGNRAFYSSGSDSIQMPQIATFNKEQEYYSTLFHEMIHSTGHEKRIGRKFGKKFGDKDYAFEELIAELGSSYLCAEAGVLYFTLKNTAAYIKNWHESLSSILKADEKFFVHAAAGAQKAANFILDVTAEKDEEKPVPKPKAPRRKKIKPVDREPIEQKKPFKKVRREKPKHTDPAEPAAASHSIHGFTTADTAPDRPADVFTLGGPIGLFLGEQQRYRLQIVLGGEKSSSKSEMLKQILDAMIDKGFKTALIDYEMGGLASKDTQAGLSRSLKAENRKKLFVSSPDFPATVEAIKGIANKFDVIGIDSGSKLNQVTNSWLDELRVEFPETIWVALMHENSRGTTKGGTAAGYNAPVVIKTYRPDPTNQLRNYAWAEKNRGNQTNRWYIIADKKVVDRDPSATQKAA